MGDGWSRDVFVTEVDCVRDLFTFGCFNVTSVRAIMFVTFGCLNVTSVRAIMFGGS